MLLFPDALFLLFAALIADALIGDPDLLWRRWPHPVVLIGKLIGFLDVSLNKPVFSRGRRKLFGTLTLILLIVTGFIIGYAIDYGARLLPFGQVLTVAVAAVFLAQKSLYQHIAAVRGGLLNDGLAGGRKAVAMIVGRDPQTLDESGVSRASIESCAENFSDGVVAPVFWFAVLGLPGLIAYKAVNTADSMIGHKTEQYRAFGWAAARFDDLINLPASRLSGLLIALSAPLAGGSPNKAFRTIRQDAGKHRSPNAGWPEAAMAGALDIALAGPRSYPGYTVEDPFLNANGRKAATVQDISRALNLLKGSCVLLALFVLVLAAAIAAVNGTAVI
ncbi:adenosylcobinamide-phosphate synthase CbiB [Roseibium aggregatum]|uniref:Cobalamin biosynthesis protein CobD n=1 Tax=Roseibium aggregatum TaxID=187304 RepID=A0A926S8B3_9HYPH|nr:adenosylcobinamide-phosphate synthase CbiB [Roseibium aggregatum]MBD1549295.1 cobalamin biosynthesis protein [Roseibium aggregatum]